MKHIIILGDGMADHHQPSLGGKTLMQYADTPYMDMLAKKGRTGRLVTVPDGYMPGSEVANTAILGYDLNQVYEGRGPLKQPASVMKWSPKIWPSDAISSHLPTEISKITTADI